MAVRGVSSTEQDIRADGNAIPVADFEGTLGKAGSGEPILIASAGSYGSPARSYSFGDTIGIPGYGNLVFKAVVSQNGKLFARVSSSTSTYEIPVKGESRDEIRAGAIAAFKRGDITTPPAGSGRPKPDPKPKSQPSSVSVQSLDRQLAAINPNYVSLSDLQKLTGSTNVTSNNAPPLPAPPPRPVTLLDKFEAGSRPRMLTLADGYTRVEVRDFKPDNTVLVQLPSGEVKAFARKGKSDAQLNRALMNSTALGQLAPGVAKLDGQLAAINPNYVPLSTLQAINNGKPIPTKKNAATPPDTRNDEIARTQQALNPFPAGGGGLKRGTVAGDTFTPPPTMSDAQVQQMRASLQASAQKKITESGKVLNATSGRSVNEVLFAARQRLSGEDTLNTLADNNPASSSYSLFFLQGLQAKLTGNNTGDWNGADKANSAAWKKLSGIEQRYNAGKIDASTAKAEIKKLITGYGEVAPQQRQQVVRDNVEGQKVDRAIESTVSTVAAITAPNPATGIVAGSVLRDGFNAANGQQNVTAAIGNTLSNDPKKKPTDIGKAVGNTALGSVLPTVVDVGAAKVGSVITSKITPVTTNVAPVIGGKVGSTVTTVISKAPVPQIVKESAPVIGAQVTNKVQSAVTNAAAPYIGAIGGQVANQGGQFIAGAGQTIFNNGLTADSLQKIKVDAISTAAGIATAPVTAAVDFVLPDLADKPFQRFATNYIAGAGSEFVENAASSLATGQQIGWGDVGGALIGGGADTVQTIDINNASRNAVGNETTATAQSDGSGKLAPRTSVYQSSPTTDANGQPVPGRVEIKPIVNGKENVNERSVERTVTPVLPEAATAPVVTSNTTADETPDFTPLVPPPPPNPAQQAVGNLGMPVRGQNQPAVTFADPVTGQTVLNVPGNPTLVNGTTPPAQITGLNTDPSGALTLPTTNADLVPRNGIANAPTPEWTIDLDGALSGNLPRDLFQSNWDRQPEPGVEVFGNLLRASQDPDAIANLSPGRGFFSNTLRNVRLNMADYNNFLETNRDFYKLDGQPNNGLPRLDEKTAEINDSRALNQSYRDAKKQDRLENRPTLWDRTADGRQTWIDFFHDYRNATFTFVDQVVAGYTPTNLSIPPIGIGAFKTPQINLFKVSDPILVEERLNARGLTLRTQSELDTQSTDQPLFSAQTRNGNNPFVFDDTTQRDVSNLTPYTPGSLTWSYMTQPLRVVIKGASIPIEFVASNVMKPAFTKIGEMSEPHRRAVHDFFHTNPVANDFRLSMRELFSGTSDVKNTPLERNSLRDQVTGRFVYEIFRTPEVQSFTTKAQSVVDFAGAGIQNLQFAASPVLEPVGNVIGGTFDNIQTVSQVAVTQVLPTALTLGFATGNLTALEKQDITDMLRRSDYSTNPNYAIGTGGIGVKTTPNFPVDARVGFVWTGPTIKGINPGALARGDFGEAIEWHSMIPSAFQRKGPNDETQFAYNSSFRGSMAAAAFSYYVAPQATGEIFNVNGNMGVQIATFGGGYRQEAGDITKNPGFEFGTRAYGALGKVRFTAGLMNFDIPATNIPFLPSRLAMFATRPTADPELFPNSGRPPGAPLLPGQKPGANVEPSATYYLLGGGHDPLLDQQATIGLSPFSVSGVSKNTLDGSNNLSGNYLGTPVTGAKGGIVRFKFVPEGFMDGSTYAQVFGRNPTAINAAEDISAKAPWLFDLKLPNGQTVFKTPEQIRFENADRDVTRIVGSIGENPARAVDPNVQAGIRAALRSAVPSDQQAKADAVAEALLKELADAPEIVNMPGFMDELRSIVKELSGYKD